MKRFLSLFLMLLMLTSISVVAFADTSAEAEGPANEISSIVSGDSTRAEETVWCFRTYQGVFQMRLWSLTYGKWLTDWIDVGPA